MEGWGEAAARGVIEGAAQEALEYYAGRTMAPPPPSTLGGGTITHPITPNILTRLRKDKIIQDFAQAQQTLGKGGLALQGGIWQLGALGQAHRQSGNVRLKYITDVDAAAHEFGHRLRDALGVRPTACRGPGTSQRIAGDDTEAEADETIPLCGDRLVPRI